MNQVRGTVGLIPLDEKYRQIIKGLMDKLFYLALASYFVTGIGFNSMALATLTPRFFIYAIAGVMGLYMMREGINCLFVERYGWRDILGLGICFLFGYIANRNDSAIPMSTFLTVFAARNIDLKKTYKLMIAVTAVTMGLIMLGAEKGYLAQYVYYQKGHSRYTLGFNYVLAPPAYIMNIAMVLLVFRKDKITWAEIAVMFILNAVFFMLCQGELSFLATLLIVGFMIWIKLWPKLETSQFVLFKWIDRIAVIIHPVCVGISVWFMLKYDESVAWMAKLNEILDRRLAIPHKVYSEYGIKLLGQKITLIGAGLGLDGKPVDNVGEYNYIDNLYINMLLRYGLVFFIVSLCLLVVMMIYCYKKNMRLWLWMLALYALHAIFDDKLQLVYFDSLMLIMGQAVQKLRLKEQR